MVVSRLVFGLPRFSFLVLMASMVAFFAETWSFIRKMWPSFCQRRFFLSHVAGSMRAFTSVDMRLDHSFNETLNQVLQPKSIMDWAYAL